MLNLARKLLGIIRRAANDPAYAPIDPDDVDQLGEALDEGGILDAAEAALAPVLDAPTVLVDTREQRPFSPFLWQGGKRVYLTPERCTLHEGDYTTPTAKDHVRVERKSIPDLYGSLFGTSCDAMGESAPNQTRLRAEFLRLQKYHRAYFVIEGGPRDLYEYIVTQNRRVDPTAAIQLVESLGFDYGITVRWSRDREAAEWFVGYVLSRAHAQATNATEAKKAVKRGLVLPWAYNAVDAVKAAADAIKKGTAA